MGFILIISAWIYLFVSLFIASMAGKLGRKYRWKYCNFWTALLLLFLIPIWDIPIGMAYHKYLCSSEAGLFVYDTVTLDDKYFYKPGDINISKHAEGGKSHAIAKDRDINREALRERYDFQFSKLSTYSPLFHISKRRREIRDKWTNRLLGESISFIYAGGWLETSVAGSARYCQPEYKPVSKQNVHSRVFKEVFGVSQF